MRVTLVFEDVETCMDGSPLPLGTVLVSVVPDHAPGLSEAELRSSPAATWAKIMVSQYEFLVKFLGGRIHEPGEN